MAYATVSDLESRWRTLSDSEKVTATARLDDAAVILDAYCPPSDPVTDQEAAVRKIVSCDMVKRSMAAGDVSGGIGVTSLQQGAGPYQGTMQFANPSGDMYLTKGDKRLLGCGVQAAFTVSMTDWAAVGAASDPWVDL